MSVARRWWPALTAASGLVGVAVAWALATPSGPDSSALLRIIADLLGSLVLGLGLLRVAPMNVPGRTENIAAIDRAAAVAAGSWAVVELGLLVVSARDSIGVTVSQLTVHSFGTFLTDISVGQLGVGLLIATSAIALLSFVRYRRRLSGSAVPVIVLAALALVARPITGHMSQQFLGALFAALHVIAAATWIGIPAAMALTVKSRGTWAVLLPRFSRIAWWCVWILLGSGVVNAAVKLRSVDALVDTGYGRVIIAKTVALLVLILLARQIRGDWLVRAAQHRYPADKSVIRAAVHVCAIAVAFGLAAALAVTAS